jgi:hypothetical protein
MTMSSAPIRLDTTEWIPPVLQTELMQHAAEFAAAEYLEDIIGKRWFTTLAADLEKACADCGVVAYHCTREAQPGEIAARGLRILEGDGDSHRTEFLVRHGNKFTAAERVEIDRHFTELWANPLQAQGRENRLGFALAHPRYWGQGCDDLLEIYGGEAVYTTFGWDGPIIDKLRTIGQPAVVHFRLHPHAIRSHHESPAGQTAIWAWHRQIRPDVTRYWCQSYTTENVSPMDIVEVENWSRSRNSSWSPGGT